MIYLQLDGVVNQLGTGGTLPAVTIRIYDNPQYVKGSITTNHHQKTVFSKCSIGFQCCPEIAKMVEQVWHATYYHLQSFTHKGYLMTVAPLKDISALHLGVQKQLGIRKPAKQQDMNNRKCMKMQLCKQ